MRLSPPDAFAYVVPHFFCHELTTLPTEAIDRTATYPVMLLCSERYPVRLTHVCTYMRGLEIVSFLFS